MRLINAEYLVNLIKAGNYCDDLGQIVHSIGEKEVNEAPTVEAISVEWIEEKAKMYDDLAEYAKKQRWGEIYSEWAHLLRQLIEKWRKENGTDRQR